MQVIHPDRILIYLAVSFQHYFEVQLRLSNKMKSLSTFCGKFSLDMIQKQQCHYKAYIGWTKALCLSGSVKCMLFIAFLYRKARAGRGWSEGWNEGWSEGWRRLPNIDTKTMHIYYEYVLCLIHFLGFFPCLFTSPQLFLFSPALGPFTFPSLPPLNTFIPVLKIRC